jgi:2-phosphosulfolactate phosphatase
VEVHELYGIESVPAARGHVVIIDVLRAFTCAAYAFEKGAEAIELVATVDEALARKRARPDVLLMGHGPGGSRPKGFDLSNSPHELERADVRGRRIVQRTGSGTPGVVAATSADAVYLAALVNASATARHLRRVGAETVSLVAMGAPHGPDGPEDVACRDVIAARLRGEEPDTDAARRVVASCPAALELRDPRRGVGHADDIVAATQVDHCTFAVVVGLEDGRPVARRVDVLPRAATSLPFDRALLAARWHRTGVPVHRPEVEALVDALLAEGHFSDDLAVLCGGYGPLGSDERRVLERVVRAAGLTVDDETALVVETLAVCRDLLEGRASPGDAARALRHLVVGRRLDGVETRWWWFAEHVEDCAEWNGRDHADREIRELARAFVREHGGPFGFGG